MSSTVNGRAYQIATMGLALTGDGPAYPLGGFSKIDYKPAAAKKPVTDPSSGKIVGYTIDNEQMTGSVEMLMEDWQALKTRCYALNPGKGMGQIVIPVLVVTFGIGRPNLMTEKVLNVMFNEDPRTAEGSQDANKVTIPLFFTDVIDQYGRRFLEPAAA